MNTAHKVIVTAMAADNLATILPDILDMLGFYVNIDMDKMIDRYSEKYYDWMMSQLVVFGDPKRTDEEDILVYNKLMLNLFAHQVLLVEIKKGNIEIN